MLRGGGRLLGVGLSSWWVTTHRLHRGHRSRHFCDRSPLLTRTSCICHIHAELLGLVRDMQSITWRWRCQYKALELLVVFREHVGGNEEVEIYQRQELELQRVQL